MDRKIQPPATLRKKMMMVFRYRKIWLVILVGLGAGSTTVGFAFVKESVPPRPSASPPKPAAVRRGYRTRTAIKTYSLPFSRHISKTLKKLLKKPLDIPKNAG